VLNIVALRTHNGWGLAGGLTTQIIALVTLYKPAWDAIRKSLKFDVSSVLKAGSYEAQISELMKLRSRFRSVVKLAVGERGRIVIFIDDLDRCTPDKVPDVLEAIKLFAATERCIYVLAFDQKVVGGRIAKKYAFEEEEGTNYLEKIVQIPFQLRRSIRRTSSSLCANNTQNARQRTTRFCHGTIRQPAHRQTRVE
jgi:hypothetical protein